MSCCPAFGCMSEANFAPCSPTLRALRQKAAHELDALALDEGVAATIGIAARKSVLAERTNAAGDCSGVPELIFSAAQIEAAIEKCHMRHSDCRPDIDVPSHASREAWSVNVMAVTHSAARTARDAM